MAITASYDDMRVYPYFLPQCLFIIHLLIVYPFKQKKQWHMGAPKNPEMGQLFLHSLIFPNASHQGVGINMKLVPQPKSPSNKVNYY